ncbi:hypothetical protein JA1_001986 [Spathaspora sp. JA1]|nr:hypothetical protein JA1_001986 [Spathaspora sp. JA1]
MSKWKLQVLLIPLDFTYVATSQVDTSVIKRFLHLADPTVELAIIKEEIEAKYKKLYPNEEPLDIDRLQDANNNDLDPDFLVNDVFASGDIVRIIVNNRFKPIELNITPFYQHQHTPVLSTPLPIAAGSDFMIGTVGTGRKRMQDYLESGNLQHSKRRSHSPIQSQSSSPVALAPPQSSDDRTIPVKKNTSSPSATSKERITSGMLVMPPHAQLEKDAALKVNHKNLPLHSVNSDSSDYSENGILSASRPINIIKADKYSQNSDSKNKTSKRSDEQSIAKEEIINEFKKGLKIPEKKLKPPAVKPIPREFQNGHSQEIIKSLHINMVDAEPDLSLDRGSRVGAREAARIAATKIALSEGSSSRNRPQKQSPNPLPLSKSSKSTGIVNPVTHDQNKSSNLNKGKSLTKQESIPRQQHLRPESAKSKENHSKVIDKKQDSSKQPTRKLVPIAPKTDLDDDSSSDEYEDVSDSKSLGRLEQFQERLRNFETDLSSITTKYGTLKKIPAEFSSRVDEELDNIQGLILDPRLILVNRENRPYNYPPDIADERMSPSESLAEQQSRQSPAKTDIIEVSEGENNDEETKSQENAMENEDSKPVDIKPVNPPAPIVTKIIEPPKQSSPEEQSPESDYPEVIDLTEDLPEETPKSILLTTIKATTSVDSTSPPLETPVKSLSPKESPKTPVVNLASNDSSIPLFFRSAVPEKHTSVPPPTTEQISDQIEPVKAKSIEPSSNINETPKKSFILKLPSTKFTASDANISKTSPKSTSKPAPESNLEKSTQEESNTADPSLNVSLKVHPQKFFSPPKVVGGSITNKSPAFQLSHNGADIAGVTNGHTIQRDGSITQANGTKRPLDDSSSGESSDEEDDASSDDDSEEEKDQIKKPRLVASIPSTIRRSQSPMVRTPTPPPKIVNKPQEEVGSQTKTDKPTIPVAPATIAATEKTSIVNIPQATPQAVSTPSTLKKPLLSSLSDLVNRGLPEVKDVNQSKGNAPIKKTEVVNESSSSEDESEDSDSGNSDSDSDDDESGKFITMKSAKVTQPKKRSNLFMSLLRN